MLFLAVVWAVPSTLPPPQSTTSPIVGGTPTGPDIWPDVVAVYSGTTPTCSGTLIAPDLVLTAGHCTPGITHVVIGASDLAVDGEQLEVVEQVAYPDALSSLDVAVVRLEGPSVAPPRMLAADCLGDFIVDGASATVAGFGRIDTAGTEDTLLLHDVQVPITDADCSDFSRGCREPGSELIAGGHGLDSCSGDSGGPLYLDTPRGTVVAGVVVRGAFPSATTCGDGGIYVRTDAIVDWVEATTGELLERPDCEGLNRPPRPTAARVELSQGMAAPLEIEVNDPDDDSHTFVVEIPPTQGWIDDALVFHAEAFQVGIERATVRVSDDGSPPLSSIVEVEIAVFPSGVLDDPVVERPGGCASAPVAPGLSWFLSFGARR